LETPKCESWVSAAFSGDPALATKLIECMIANTTGGTNAIPPPKEQQIPARKAETKRVPHWSRVVQHFQATSNKPISIPRLAKTLGIHRGVASGLIYNAHNDDVEFVPNPKRRGGKLWRLKATTVKAEKGGQL
jgi:hypothetical protein